jgi:hypothetical protein
MSAKRYVVVEVDDWRRVHTDAFWAVKGGDYDDALLQDARILIGVMFMTSTDRSQAREMADMCNRIDKALEYTAEPQTGVE